MSGPGAELPGDTAERAPGARDPEGSGAGAGLGPSRGGSDVA